MFCVAGVQSIQYCVVAPVTVARLKTPVQAVHTTAPAAEGRVHVMQFAIPVTASVPYVVEATVAQLTQ
jgi:hypothetical protein